jgi:hypothetical protein
MRNLIYIFLLLPLLVWSQTIPDKKYHAGAEISKTYHGGVEVWSAASSSAIDLPSLVVKLTPNGVDATATVNGNDVDVWNDESGNGLHATNTGTNSPELLIEGGERHVRFDGTDFLTFGQPAALNFVGGTDEFTIIVKLGATVTNGNQVLVAKAQINMTTTGQYAIHLQSNLRRYHVGGNISYGGTDWAADDIITMVARTTGKDAYVNNVSDGVSDDPVGTATVTNDVLIGARYDGTSYPLNGTLAYVLIYNAELTPTELTAIYNEIN